MDPLTHETRQGDPGFYDALVSRDARFDGRFFVGVRTTGVYCRPICPAPKPRSKNCQFYRTAPEAERAGFRPCKRCRPETAPTSAAWLGTCSTVRRALRLIADGALNEASVNALAGRLGVGERHLRRLFDRHVGAAPSEVAATQRLHLARQLLVQTRLPMTEVAIASGYASLRRFNAAFKAAYGAPPSDLRVGAKAGAVSGSAAPITLVLGYVPPYDWEALLGFLRTRAIPGVEACDEGHYTRTIELDSEPGFLRVGKDPDRYAVIAEVWIGRVVSLLPIVERLRALFDLDAEPTGILETLRSDARLGPFVEAAPGLRVPGCWDPFELAVRAILGQQVTVAAARTLAGRLVQRWGRPIPIDGQASIEEPYLFPTPEVLADAEIETIGMPGRRAETLRSLSKAVFEGKLRLDPSADQDLFRAGLLDLAGIGEWTAGYIEMRALKDPDAFPAKDIALLRAAQRLAIAETHAELQEAAETWRPWRAYSVLHLWRSLAAGAADGD